MLTPPRWLNPFATQQNPDSRPGPVEARANQIINQHTIAGIVVGLVPLPPLFDVVAVTAVEVHLIAKLADAYSVPIPQRHVWGKVLISLAGGIAPVFISEKSSEMVAGVPLLGYAVFRAGLSIWGGVAVYAVGKAFAQHFQSGGTFLSTDNTILQSLLAPNREPQAAPAQ